MKKSIITIVLACVAMVVSAQPKDNENFRKRLFEARLAEMNLQLELTDEQKTKFAPIYEQYCNEMQALRGRQHQGRPQGPGMHPGGPRPGGERGMRPDGPRPQRDAKPDKKDGKKQDGKKQDDKKKDGKPQQQKPKMSDADRVARMKERMEAQKRAQEIRLSYVEKFSTVLSDKQLLDFFDVEDKIQEKLQERAFKGRQ